MILKALAFLLVANLALHVSCQNDMDSYLIEHSIDTGAFKEIGHLNLRTIKQNQNQYQLQTYSSLNEDLHESDKPRFHNVFYATPVETALIDDQDKADIKQALVSTKNSLYRVRLCKKGGSDLDCSVGTFTYLKHIAESNYQFNLTLVTGTNNRISSISIKTRSKPSETSLAKALNNLDHFTLYTSVQSIKQGQTPESEAYLEKVKKEMEQKQKAAEGGGESFFTKYWMYIVPFVVIMFLMNLANPEGAA